MSKFVSYCSVSKHEGRFQLDEGRRSNNLLKVFLFGLCVLCVLLFYFWVLLLLSGGLASFCALTINF